MGFWEGFEKRSVSKEVYDRAVRNLMNRIGGEAAGNKIVRHAMRSLKRGKKLEGHGKILNALNFDMRKSSLHDVGAEFGSKLKG